VRDADLQENVNRYVAETCYTLPLAPDWELARRAVWYWTRIIVEITPVRVYWWDSPAALDDPPHRWDAPAGTAYPASDPAPPGTVSKPPEWELPAWRELAERALERGVKGYLSLVDQQGFPISVRIRSMAIAGDGLALELPRGLPCPVAGKACLTFGGIETFIGEMTGDAFLRVERVLPVFPMTSDMTQLWKPSAHTREELMRRLQYETERRGQPIPTIPLEPPLPTEGYRRRMARVGKA
jgi:hypothetical protein